MKRVFFILICLFFNATPVFALGDLLLSVKERTQIDLLRHAKEGTQNAKEAQPTDVEVNGFFFQKSEKRENGTLWVNGARLKNNSLYDDLRLREINKANSTVSIQLGETGGSVPMKAGQRLMLEEGRIRDAYQYEQTKPQ